MKHGRSIAALAALLAMTATVPTSGSETGSLERLLIDVPTAQGALDDVARLNEEVHYPASVGDRDMAYWMRDKLRAAGFDARVESFTAQVPQFKNASITMLGSGGGGLDLKEEPIPQDPDGSRKEAGIPFNAGSASGTVTAALVYASRGLESDYRTLASAGVSPKGAIVLIRYGAQFRGDLARRAEAHGAAGVILYSDPADRDGSSHGPAYPDGPYRPLGSVQRGSVGWPVMHIPVLPISANNARTLLQWVNGDPGPAGWRGGLDAPYALGYSKGLVRLSVSIDYPTLTLWNTVGVLAGSDTSRSVILGAHRDAWVYGGTDDGSGISTELEAARALGYLYRTGWRPNYSIVIAGFDGEEIGELGSNAYVHAHKTSLERGCIAYINSDESVTGNFFAASAAAPIAHLLPPLAQLIQDPHQRTRTLWEAWRHQQGGVTIQPPGGGSDFEAFQYVLGVPTMDLGFEGPFGVYHSAYDDLRYATTQADPSFAYHRTVAQLLALLLARITTGPLPYRLADYPPRMRNALAQLGNGGFAGDLTPVNQAIARLDRRQRSLGARIGEGATIEAVHRLDLILYGRSGYQAVAFPDLSEARAGGDHATVQHAAATVAASIDAVTGTLGP
jgi:N-acetylated-alpha-linked acidic dipeptidase